ncbi:N-acetylmuramic acid 6-phosphate etherase [uncultured Pseudokineococcus sp.]|uniref:N-acetylmuramic acid 6-phosphate etherase n=1 Tax=uncultured Pseudokineococcus sp. TaxID=1642928 RepID=UPI002602DBF0|nr:N-acetylmuramic acid 6-phosphate etherase [uncultured Pseudokineococcus sp.]
MTTPSRSTGGPPADADALSLLATERTRPDLADLDARSTRDVVAVLAAADAEVPAAVAAAGEAIAAAVDLVVERLERGGRMVYVGAGTPGRLAVVDASELPPTFGTDPDLVVAVMAGGPAAMAGAREGAEDDAEAGAADVRARGVGPDDVVVGITASGRTPYVLGAVDAARAAGAGTVGVSSNPGAALSARVDVAVEVDTGPEVVAGSTRLKAGTAQKLVLNQLSTAVMVRRGKTFGNLMVDVRVTNAKLAQRVQRMVAEATGADRDAVARAVADAGGHAGTAVVALLARVDAERARELLAAAGGRVRVALETAGAGAGGPSPDA